MVEVLYRNNGGSTDTPCPFGEKIRLVGGILTGQSANFRSEEIRIVGSSTCTECKYYAGCGSTSEKAGTSRLAGWSQGSVIILKALTNVKQVLMLNQ